MVALSFNLPAEATTELITKVTKASAFQSAARKQYVPGTGAATPVLGAVEAGWNGRGEKKKVSTPGTDSKLIMPYNLAVMIPLANELFEDDKTDQLEEAIIAQGVGALARKFDETVLGLNAAPGSDFHTFATTDTVQVTDRATFVAALAAVAQSGATPDSFVLSSSLYYELLGATLANGNAAFDIRDNRINGIEYFIVDGVTEKIGVLGAFKTQAVWGTVSDVHIKTSDTASWTKGVDTVGHAFEENVTLTRIEGRFGFQVADEDAFVVVADEENGS